MPFSGELTATLDKDGKSAECEGFSDPTLEELCRRFLKLGFSPYVTVIVKQRRLSKEKSGRNSQPRMELVEIARIKLSDPVRYAQTFDINDPESYQPRASVYQYRGAP